MNINSDRRHFVGGLLGLGGLAMLPGCVSAPGFSLNEAVRDLLRISSQQAFARLLQPGGFYDSQISRIALPEALAGGSGAMGAILRSSAVRTELQALLNGFAEQGAERAASVVAEAIRSMTIADAAAIVRGGSTAATDYLRGSMRTSLIDVMVPEIGMVMRSAESGLLSQVVRAATGYDLNALAGDLSSGAEAAIWRSIGAEEANIRANPQQTNNPLLIGIFGLR